MSSMSSMWTKGLISIFSSIILLQLVVNCTGEMITPHSPRVVLQTSTGIRGSLSSVGKNYPDLSVVGFDNKAQSACVTGTWIFYGSKNYANFSDGVSVLFSKNNKCFIFDHLSEKVSSMRFAGSRTDIQHDHIDLFSGRFFTGIHLRSNWNIHNVTATGITHTNSLIVSGNSGWTLYDQPNFSGTHKCVTPMANQLPRWFRNSIELGGMNVQSYQKGC